MTADAILVGALRDGLAELADPEKAPAMQRYMKSAMPFRGVQTPEHRRLVRAILAERAPADRATWEATVRELWDHAAHREERYVAIDLCGHRLSPPSISRLCAPRRANETIRAQIVRPRRANRATTPSRALRRSRVSTNWAVPAPRRML